MPGGPVDDTCSDRPFFSVVIPIFNRAGEVQPTLASVARQTFTDLECIVVDDGSMDSAVLREVIEGLEDVRFRYVRQDNAGASAARNTGVREALGDYVAYLDSDDLFLPDKLERVAEVIRSHPEAAIYSLSYVDRGVGRFWVRPDRAISETEDMADYLFVHNQFIPTCSLVLPRRVALAFPFDPSLKHVEDPDLCFRLHRGGIRFEMIDEPLAIWNDASGENRLSHVGGSEAPLRWLEKWRPHLSKRAERGYRATVLAYFLARRHPMLALRDLAAGWALAGVPSRIVLRQLLRCVLPRGAYRRLVNAFVAARGSRKGHRAASP